MKAKVAIVGSGPSGCYAAQALLKAAPDLQVDIIDALPVPFGLVRYGVASDHQGTKAVSRQFSRIFERQGAGFFGNVRIGQDISLATLRSAYDAVILAAGLSADRKLGIPGDTLPGVYGSAALTRALHEHPEADALPDLGSAPVIVGNGNVAIDLLRVLAKTADELHGSDLGPGPTAWLAANRFETLTVIGRSPAGKAKFDPVMVRELAKLTNVTIDVAGVHSSEDEEERKRLEALSEIHGHAKGSTRIIFRFGLQLRSVEGTDRVSGLKVASAEGEEIIPASSILTAIGFQSSGDFDREALLSAAEPDASGKLAENLFAAGWFWRGPRGTIPDSRTEAQALATRLLEEISPNPDREGSHIFAGLRDVVDYTGWQKIDSAELAAAAPNRCRQKLAGKNELLRVAGEQETNS
ncbi:FAD-dependent oxidoreductase [Tianweitania sediminis]|uniref:FAD-dependent oxidoreductase n=1 Tax=Tianweitania sediminis TaxID=1502156 RepID=A0A8J7UIA8_9HYPH|nr:FAD-dependent oxidoreductase [Tianweitania sediminis]MBP0438708.1 FAD-dependent oxidoreductase [Tianweitania sediminis]